MTAGQRVFVGLDIGASKIAGVVFDGREILARERRPLPTDADAEAIVALAAEMAEALMAQRRSEFESLGVGVPGVVSSDRARVAVAQNLTALNGLELPRLLSERLRLPVVMDNDVHAAALGELRYGKAGDSFVFISLGTGVGGAIVEKGEILCGHGAQLSAGEIGHMRLREGKTFEQLASQQFLATTPLRDIKTFLAALSIGDPGVEDVAPALARGIGEGLGNIINVLDPAVIVLAGGLANAWFKLESDVRAVIRTVVLSSEAQETPIRIATFGDYAGAVGAATLTIPDGDDAQNTTCQKA